MQRKTEIPKIEEAIPVSRSANSLCEPADVAAAKGREHGGQNLFVGVWTTVRIHYEQGCGDALIDAKDTPM